MVLQSTRPRREAASASSKRAAAAPSIPKSSTPLSTRIKRTSTAVQQRRVSSPTVDSDQDSSGLSEEEDEDDVVEAEMMMSSSESEDEENDKTSDYEETGKAKRKRNGMKKPKAKGPVEKRAKTSNATGSKKPRAKAANASKRKGGGGAGSARSKASTSKENLPINEDNKLFNNVKDVDRDLQETAVEWVAYYQDNPGMALAQLINFVFRCSGCNETIDETQALDLDEVADILDVIQEKLKKEVMPSYPLVSRSPSFRNFRRRLSEWTDKLFVCADEADVVYDDTMMETMTAWISAMTSSAVRSLRHTSTVVALLMIEQVNSLTRENRKQIQAAAHSRDTERKKGVTANKVLLKSVEAKVKELNAIRKKLDVYQRELLDTVFIHRYRDSDPVIRADCISELGRWMKTYPDPYLSTSYFAYLGWMLSDENEKVRLVALKSVEGLYTRHEYSGAIETFTNKFRARMIEMAVLDIDAQVRVTAIAVLRHVQLVDGLEEESQETLTLHLFDVEPKVRAATAKFVKTLLDEQLQESEEQDDSKEFCKMRWKVLADWLTRLNILTSELEDKRQDEVFALDSLITIGEGVSSRTALAIAALWEVDDKLHDWSALIELLLYDHSRPAGEKGKGRKKTKGSLAQDNNGDAPPNDDYRLVPEAEAVLLEALSAVLQRVQLQSQLAQTGQDGDTEEDEYSNVTRDLITVLPRLFKKYKTEAERITDVLAIVKGLKMDTFVGYQQVAAFEALWDGVIDQYLRHAEGPVLSLAVQAMAKMSTLKEMSNTITQKMGYLRDTVMQDMREISREIDLRETELDDDLLHQLTLNTTRIRHLIRAFDLTEEVDGGGADGDEAEHAIDANMGWSILLSCAKRGALGVGSEEELVENAVVVLSACVMWTTRAFLAKMASEEEQAAAANTLCQKRAALIDILHLLIEDESGCVTLSVKRQALRQCIGLYVLFAGVQATLTARQEQEDTTAVAFLPLLQMKCDKPMQEKMTTFINSELTRYADSLRKSSGGSAEADSEEDDTQEETRRSSSSTTKQTSRPSLRILQRELDFVSSVSHFVGAIQLGIVNIRASVGLLSQFGRLGTAFDACLRTLVETIREVGIQEDKASQACNVVLDSLWMSHNMYCKEDSSTSNAGEGILVHLAKMLSSCLVVRGAQLAILKSVDGQALVSMHRRGLSMVFERLQKDRGSDAAQYEKQKILVFFKALSQLLISVGPRDAILIKKEMDDQIADRSIEVPLTSKMWDPLRQYEKRLVTIASKSDSVRKHVEAVKSAKTSSKQAVSLEKAAEQDEMEEDGGDETGSLLMQDSRLEEEEDVFGQITRDDEQDNRQMDITMDDKDAEGDDYYDE